MRCVRRQQIQWRAGVELQHVRDWVIHVRRCQGLADRVHDLCCRSLVRRNQQCIAVRQRHYVRRSGGKCVWDVCRRLIHVRGHEYNTFSMQCMPCR